MQIKSKTPVRLHTLGKENTKKKNKKLEMLIGRNSILFPIEWKQKTYVQEISCVFH